MDQVQDRNLQGLHQLDTAFGLPAFVKNASVEELRGGETLEPHMFADITRRQFPCHTPAAIWTSAGFFYQKHAEFTPALAKRIESRIKQSASFHGILPHIEALATKTAVANTVDETELPDSVFAIVMDFDAGQKERRYPMRSANEVKQAAEYIANYRDDFRYSDRQRIADKILEKSAEYGADISEHRYRLEKMAGLGACAGKDAAALIRSRLSWLGSKSLPLVQEFDKLASAIEKNPAEVHHYSMLVKLAETLDQLDHAHHLKRHYDKTLQRPEDVLFAVTEKVAAEQSQELVGTLTGNYYKKADLQHVPVNALGDALGNDFASEVSTANAWLDVEKLATIAPTLPLSDAELFDAVVTEFGVQPFATKSAAGKRIPDTDLAKMASAHQPGRAGGLWANIRE